MSHTNNHWNGVVRHRIVDQEGRVAKGRVAKKYGANRRYSTPDRSWKHPFDNLQAWGPPSDRKIKRRQMRGTKPRWNKQWRKNL